MSEKRPGGRLFADGASRGNPGPAGAGCLLLPDSGKAPIRFATFLGVATNNQAEYRALIMGLEEALSLGWERVEVSLDSELIVRQIKGEYRVKNPGLKPLFEEASRLLKRFHSFSINHVPRELNTDADRLANRAIDLAHKKAYNRGGE